MATIEKVQQWYAAQCDGEWEHQYGLSIDTLDNPGWSVSIDLIGTVLHDVNMEKYQQDNSPNDWIFCEIKNQTFIGICERNLCQRFSRIRSSLQLHLHDS